MFNVDTHWTGRVAVPPPQALLQRDQSPATAQDAFTTAAGQLALTHRWDSVSGVVTLHAASGNRAPVTEPTQVAARD